MHDETDLDLRVGTTDGAPSDLYRVIDAATLATSRRITSHGRGLVTGLSMVVLAAGAEAFHHVSAVLDWAPPELRVELLLHVPDEQVTRRLDQLAWPWSAVLPRGDGTSCLDRMATMDAATAQATGEFVVVTAPESGGDPTPLLASLDEALGIMWVDAADAMVLGGGLRSSEMVPGPDARAEHLAVGLGLWRGAGERRATMVVLRRWVARFLFEEIGRAIDPMQELTERVRLLELRLVAVTDIA